LNSQEKQLGKERVGGLWKGKLWDGRGTSKVEKRSRNLERLRSGEKKEGRWVGGEGGELGSGKGSQEHLCQPTTRRAWPWL